MSTLLLAAGEGGVGYQLVQVAGSLLILAAFAASQAGRLPIDSRLYLALNFVGEGLAEALAGVDVVVDVTNSPSWEDKAVLEFFETSTRNILAAEAAAGVKHHVALSVVGPTAYRTAATCGPRLLRKS